MYQYRYKMRRYGQIYEFSLLVMRKQYLRHLYIRKDIAGARLNKNMDSCVCYAHRITHKNSIYSRKIALR